MEKLYTNIGGKLRTLAKICGAIGIVCFCIGVLIELVTMFDVFNGMLILTLGILGLLCLISSWPLYAFGQLVHHVHKMSGGPAITGGSASDDLPEL